MIVVWGQGAALSLRRWSQEATEAAARVALQQGFDAGAAPDRWAIEVEVDDLDTFNAATLHDPAVLGWVPLTEEAL
jgi:hypothetical protein